jgi:acyl-CoA thioester hydrolase
MVLVFLRKGAEAASAHGTFTHVFVDREADKSVPIPQQIRAALEAVSVAI